VFFVLGSWFFVGRMNTDTEDTEMRESTEGESVFLVLGWGMNTDTEDTELREGTEGESAFLVLGSLLGE
jgi:hypothetical protein